MHAYQGGRGPEDRSWVFRAALLVSLVLAAGLAAVTARLFWSLAVYENTSNAGTICVSPTAKSARCFATRELRVVAVNHRTTSTCMNNVCWEDKDPLVGPVFDIDGHKVAIWLEPKTPISVGQMIPVRLWKGQPIGVTLDRQYTNAVYWEPPGVQYIFTVPLWILLGVWLWKVWHREEPRPQLMLTLAYFTEALLLLVVMANWIFVR